MALTQPSSGTQPAAVGLVEQVGDAAVEQRAHGGHAEEVVLDVAVGEDGQGQGRIRAAQHGAVVLGVTVTVEPVAHVGDQPFDGVTQVVGTEQLVLDDPPGEDAVADLVTEEGIGFVEEVEQRW